MENLLPFYQIMIDHVENNDIHVLTGLVKVGEVTPETFNNYEIHDYIKVQFANAIPDNCYLSKLLFKVFEPFANTGTEHINSITNDAKNYSNEQNNIIIDNLNTNNKDIDITFTLSDVNSATWNAGNIGVFAYFVAIPILLEASRQIEFYILDGDAAPVSGVQIIINDEIAGTTDDTGTAVIDATTENIDYTISKDGYTPDTGTISKGTNDISEHKTLNIIVAETRRFSLTVKDTNQEVIPGAEVFITDVSIGTTNLNGIITGDVPVTPFSIGITKNNLVFTPIIIEAGTEPVETTKELIRTLTVHVTDSLFTPIAGVSVYADNVLLGVTNAQGNYPTCQINPSVTNIKLTKEHYFEGNHNIDPLFSLDYSYNCFEVCRHLHILVKDIMDAPIPGVTVNISGIYAGLTNLNGVFEKDITVQATSVDLIKTLYTQQYQAIEAGSEDINATPVLLLTPITRNMNITVHNIYDLPVNGADIYNGYASYLGTTDSNGQATFAIPNEGWTLHIKKTHLIYTPEYIDAGIIDINKNVSMTAARNIHIAVVDHNAMPIMYAQILKDNVAIGDTDAMGIYNDTITFDEFTLGLHENSHFFTPILIPQGTDDLTLPESMYSLRVLDITLTDELEAAVSGADILFNDVIIGQTGITGNYTGNISSQAFTLNIQKTGFLFTPESMPADMDPLTISKLLPSVRTLNLYFQKPGELPAVGISVYNGLVKIGESLPNGHAIVQISRLLDINLTCTANHYFEADYFLAAGNSDWANTVNVFPCRSLMLTVTDTDETPLINAHVKQRIGEVETSLGYTDINGVLPTVSVDVAEFTLEIEKAGFSYIPEVINAGVIDLTITKQMMALRTLNLLVTDNTLPIAVPLANVQIYLGEFHLGDTGVDGYLHVGIPETAVTVRIELVGKFTQNLMLPEGIIEINQTIALLPCRSLILTVTDTDDAPLINVEVKVDDYSFGYTNGLGHLTANVTLEEFTLKIEKAGYGYIPELINAGVIDLTITKQMMALRSLDLLVTDNSEIPVPLTGAHIYIGEFHLGDTGLDGYLNAGIPETETTITASLADYTTQDLIIVAGIVSIDRTIALVPAGE